jgi:hypothetical protein
MEYKTISKIFGVAGICLIVSFIAINGFWTAGLVNLRFSTDEEDKPSFILSERGIEFQFNITIKNDQWYSAPITIAGINASVSINNTIELMNGGSGRIVIPKGTNKILINVSMPMNMTEAQMDVYEAILNFYLNNSTNPLSLEMFIQLSYGYYSILADLTITTSWLGGRVQRA